MLDHDGSRSSITYVSAKKKKKKKNIGQLNNIAKICNFKHV